MPKEITGLGPATSWTASSVFVLDTSGTLLRIDGDDLFGATTPIPVEVKMGSNGASIADGSLTINGSATTGTTPSSSADDLVIDGTGARGITVLGSDANNVEVVFGDTAANRQGGIVYSNATDQLYLRAGALNSLRVDAGLQFWDGSAWGDSLDRYETETDWTPDLQFGGLKVGITYGTQVGKYFRLGNLVWIYCRIVLTSKGSSTGSAQIRSLPVSGTSDTDVRCPLAWGPTDNMVLSDITTASVNGAFIEFQNAASGASRASLDDTDFENTSELTLSGWYYVD